MKKKTVKIAVKLHTQLKSAAALKGMSLSDYVELKLKAGIVKDE